VLAHAGGDDGVAAGQFVEQFDHHLREDDLVGFTGHVIVHVLGFEDFVSQAIAKGRLGFPRGDLRLPGFELILKGRLRTSSLRRFSA
jgi:hypothetical protein